MMSSLEKKSASYYIPPPGGDRRALAPLRKYFIHFAATCWNSSLSLQKKKVDQNIQKNNFNILIVQKSEGS